jgi:hypothetical protein
MKELVENNLVHRNLNPESIWLQNNTYKISDFIYCCKL